MSTLIYEKRGPVAVLTLNRPEKLNALDAQLHDALADAWEDITADPSLRVAVINGGEGRAFSVGADLVTAMPRVLEGDQPRREDRRSVFPDTPKPVIAAIHGYCLAGALALVLRCDIRIGATNTQIGGSGAKLGLFPIGQCARLAQVIPYSKAMYMLMQAEYLNAHEAYECGLLDKVVPPEELMPTALRVAERIAANAPGVVEQIKTVAYRAVQSPLEETEALEQEYFLSSSKTADAREGMAAWAERRTPNFTGS